MHKSEQMHNKRNRFVFLKKNILYSMKIMQYNREKAVEYARKWAYARNPAFYNFNRIGGDCTNFASQCLFAGSGVMNYTSDIGWFYRSINDRSAAWTGVEFFYRFLTENYVNPIGSGVGPFAEELSIQQLEIGDFVQFGRGTGDFYHTPIVVGFSRGEPLLAAHSYDVFDKPLSMYQYDQIRCLHILGVRK